jgi:hypothetical protein
MFSPQSFVDNLKNLELVMSVALDHVLENRDDFLDNATRSQLRKAENAIRKIRGHIELLEKQFDHLEFYIPKNMRVQ